MLLQLPLIAVFLSPVAAWVVPSYVAVGESKSTEYETVTKTRGIRFPKTSTTVKKYIYTSSVSRQLTITAPPFNASPTATITTTSGLVTFEIIHIPLSELSYPLPTKPFIYYSDPRHPSPTHLHWIEPRTYTAGTTYPRQWTLVTTTTVYPPAVVEYQLEPTSTSMGVDTYLNSTIPEYWLYLTSGAVSAMTTDTMYERYATDCSEPYHMAAGKPGVTWDPGPPKKLALWVIVLVTVPPILFLAGFVESYFWFRRSMRGKSALRLGTICWVCIGLLAALLCKREKAVGKRERTVLERRWEEMRGGERWRLWWRWGFRWKYPAELLGERSGVGVLSPRQVGTGGGREVKGAVVVEEESSSGGTEGREAVAGTVPVQPETQEPEHRPSAASPYLGSPQRWDAQQRTSGADGYLGSFQRWR